MNNNSICKQDIFFVRKREEKVEAILAYSTPKTIWDMAHYFGAVNYFRVPIASTAQVQASLNDQLEGAEKRDN